MTMQQIGRVASAAAMLLLAYTGRASAVTATRTPDPVTIDGHLSDPAWSTGHAVTHFTQNVPDDGRPATEVTRVVVLYDDTALYIGAELRDSGAVTERLGRRDADLESDWFRVYVDAQHDGRTGFGFFVNPSNVQRDVMLFDDSLQDAEWDGVWTSATRVHSGGWTAELRIPLAELRFPRRAEQTWRVNFARQILRRNEIAYYVNVPRNEAGFVSRFAELEGIRDLQLASTMDVRPYLKWRGDARDTISAADPVNRRRESTIEGGVDFTWRPRPSATLTGAIRPDFGQVEVDPAAINLSEYELFFPEKRPFFIEGANKFAFGTSASNTALNYNITPPMTFYSRRIGRQPQGTAALDRDYVAAPLETTIVAAGKLTARTARGWSIGLLAAVTEEEQAHVGRTGDNNVDRIPVEPRTHYFVLRSSKELGTRGAAGVMLTSVIRDDVPATSFLRSRAWSGGIDGNWRFGAARDILVEWLASATMTEGSAHAIALTQRSSAHYYQRPDAGHVDYDPNRTRLDGFAGRLLIAKQAGRWRYHAQAQTYSPGYETNDAGFLQRGDITATHLSLIYNDTATTPLFRERKLILSKFQNWNYDGDLISNGLQSDNYVTFGNYITGALFTGITTKRIDDRHTRGGPAVLQPLRPNLSWKLGSDRRRPIWLELFQRNTWNTEGSFDHGVSVTLSYRAARNVTVGATPSWTRSRTWAQYVTSVGDAAAMETFGRRYVFATLDQRIIDMAVRIDWSPTPSLSVQAYVQPYVAAGAYTGFKELERPRSLDYRHYGPDAIRGDGDVYTIDPGGDAAPFTISDPDFSFRSMRANVVVRWEYRAGSTLYFVWNENRARTFSQGAFDFDSDVSSLASIPAERVVLVKASYRFEW